MSRKFKLIKDYYDEGYDLYKKSTITLNPGVTVLVGCNGSGKTTMLRSMESQLKKENIPVITFDNLKDGGSRAMSAASFYGNIGFMATAMASSEGENIVMNVGNLASILRNFILIGEVASESKRFSDSFAKSLWGDKKQEKEKKKKEIPKERWILLDAVDSGLSVDNVVDIKEQLFKTILAEKFDGEIYIVISANEYELARGEDCFDVYNGKYVKFSNYEEYRNFILKSREIKDSRWADEGEKGKDK